MTKAIIRNIGPRCPSNARIGLERDILRGSAAEGVVVKRKGGGDSLERRIGFIREIDKLKKVLRQTLIMSGGRRENSAEHSWHLAMMVILLDEYAAGRVNAGKALKMALVHDIPEIYAGDTFIYDKRGQSRRAAREKAAAKRIFSRLPKGQASELFSLWAEFEEKRTPEAMFVGALDRLEPMICNYMTKGRAWRKHRVTARMVFDLNRAGMEFAPALWSYAERMLKSAVRKGMLKS